MEAKTEMILVVDDNLQNREYAGDILEDEGYKVLFASNGGEGLKLSNKFHPDVILLDVRMPDVSGLEVCRILKADAAYLKTKIIITTARVATDDIVSGYNSGADDYVSKPFGRTELIKRIDILLKTQRSENKHIHQYSVNTTWKPKTNHQDLWTKQLHLSKLAESHDLEIEKHIIRMACYASRLGQEAGLDSKTCDMLLYSAPLHDIGKIAIRNNILYKNRLTIEDTDIIMAHTTIGNEILSRHNIPILKAAAEIAFSHHEKWDGSGYPNYLKKENIPIFGRITGLVDTFDNLTRDTPNRSAWSVMRAMSELILQSGKYFDPVLINCFKKILPEILEIKKYFLKT